MQKSILILIFIFLSISFLNSIVINIPTDQPTIQLGIETSANGDTVLVQPGTYFENLDYDGKNITIASLFLTTQDTTYISNTIIDGSQPSNPNSGSVITFDSGENSSAILTGFTIKNGSGTFADPSGSGYYHYNGGGIYCINSNPNLSNLNIINNTVELSGAGIYCYNSDVSITNSVISNNTADGGGGGICCIGNSNLTVINAMINNNSATSSGGGVFLHSESDSQFEDVIISQNFALGSGGGICSYSSNIDLENSVISENVCNNDGGGISTYNAEINLSETNIIYNSSQIKGGGIYGAILNFDSVNRSNIYSNSAQFGNDLYNNSGNIIDVIVDTFTVLYPTNFHAYPINRFTFDILHEIQPQVNTDLYVSPDGDNSNSGLSFADPLQTISYALSIIVASSEDPRTIYLNSGTYSPETNGESFPILCSSWVSIVGVSEESTILDADQQESVINCYEVEGVSIENVTLTNGSGCWDGGGIFCLNSELDLLNVTISDCGAGTAGGISHISSNSVFDNITVINNEAKHYGGIFSSGSTLTIINSNIISNHADETAGGLYLSNIETHISSTNIIGNSSGCNGGGFVCSNSEPILQNVLISNNTSSEGGGINCWNANPILENVTIVYNYANYSGGGIHCSGTSNPVFDEDNRCNIYLNTSPSGNDLYSEDFVSVVVDTFTVTAPTGYYATPISNFSFDIQHGLIEQVNADLYVSPAGDNTNDGLSSDSPLKTITFALSKILVDSLNQHTIFLSDGTFSPETNEEIFPIRLMDYISLAGMGIDSTFISVGEVTWDPFAFIFDGIQHAVLSNMTITNSYGIDCRNNSSPILRNLNISDNLYYGIYCHYDSDPVIQNCVIANNYVGIKCSYYSSPIIINSTIAFNISDWNGGGLYSYNDCHPVLVNSILCGNIPQEIEMANYNINCSVTISNCNILGGESGIVTGSGTVNWLEGNIDANPLFVNVSEDYHLQDNSPCIDAGTDFFEWQGNTLLDLSPEEYIGIAPDMGAYEWEGTNIEEELVNPTVTKLIGNYPNPFNPSTTISFSLNTESSENIEISIFNIKGQRIKNIPVNLSGVEGTGQTYSVTWNGKDENDQPVASGIYFYQLNVDDKVIASKKCLLLK